MPHPPFPPKPETDVTTAAPVPPRDVGNVNDPHHERAEYERRRCQDGKKTLVPDAQTSWTREKGDQLQEAIDRVFSSGESLPGLDFSFTIADPFLDDCPLIAFSTGFTKLCGYTIEDVVGQNCRFLVEGVPSEQLDQDARKHAKAFCQAVKLGKEYAIPLSDQKPWMRRDRPGDENVMMQRNRRKDGSLFNSLVYMKVFELGAELGESRPYIVGLQAELKDGAKALAEISKNLEQLETRMILVKSELASLFFVQSSMSRETSAHRILPGITPYQPTPMKSGYITKDSGVTAISGDCKAFPAEKVQPWEQDRFTHVKHLCDAPRNKGVVQLMRDQTLNEFIAIKQMPNTWLQASHQEFVKKNPLESEFPWQDMGFTHFLNSKSFEYACNLEGVYRSDDSTFVAMTYASHGDLFAQASAGVARGPGREKSFAPIVLQLFSGIKQLHNMQIAHRDMSLENVLLTKKDGSDFQVKIIDYGMASTKRMFKNCIRGKESYQAPEMHSQESHDAFLSETFATGVLLYCLFLADYPWASTKPGACKRFEYVKSKGLRGFCAQQPMRKSESMVGQCLSEPLLELLEGMLTINPKSRLTFGEVSLPCKKSIWDMEWMKIPAEPALVEV